METPWWIHCNVCAALLASNETSFYMLTCDHLLCKECITMPQTERGTKCPICKTAIKYTDLRKLSQEQKERFQPNAFKELRKTLNLVKFQNTQMNLLAKLTQEQKIKAKKAAQYHAMMSERIMKKKALLNKMTEQRKLMQQRLKETYLKNQKKKQSQMYRDQEQTFSSNASHSSKISGNSKGSTTSFFSNANAPNPWGATKVTPALDLFSTNFFGSSSKSNRNSARNSMFGGISSMMHMHKNKPPMMNIHKSQSMTNINHNQRHQLNERSQANRSPFFA